MFSTIYDALRSLARWDAVAVARRSAPDGTPSSARAASPTSGVDPLEADANEFEFEDEDESDRLESVFLNSTPSARAFAFAELAKEQERAAPPAPTGTPATYTSLWDALTQHFDETDRNLARQPAAGYVRNPQGLGNERRYPLKPSEHVEFARAAKIVGVSTGTKPKSATVECRVDVCYERTRGDRVDVSHESVPLDDFVMGKLGKKYEFVSDALTPLRRAEMCEAVFKAQSALFNDDSWETNGTVDLFFNEFTNFLPAGHANISGSLKEWVRIHFDPLEGARFAVVSYDASAARHRSRWDSDELAARAPWRVVRFDTGELVDFTSSEMRTVCLWRVGARRSLLSCATRRIERYERNAHRHKKRNIHGFLKKSLIHYNEHGALGLSLARHTVEIGAGSGLSSRTIAATSSKTADGRAVVCYALDPYIRSFVHDSVRNDPHVVLVEQCIEDVDVSRIPPVGIVRFVLAAPECAAVSVAATPHYKHLRDKYGCDVGDLIRACAIRLTSAMTRCCVDFIRYLNAPSVIENPTGNAKVGLFNERLPFYGWQTVTVETSYCKYTDGHFRKHTTFVTNVSGLTLEPPCSCARLCAERLKSSRHRLRCSHTEVPRSESKLHPPALIRSIVEQVDDFIDRLCSAHLARDENDDAERAGALVDPATLARADELIDARERKVARRSIGDLRPSDRVSVLGRSESGSLETWCAEVVDSGPPRRDRVRVRYLAETSPGSGRFEYESPTGDEATIRVNIILGVHERGHVATAWLPRCVTSIRPSDRGRAAMCPRHRPIALDAPETKRPTGDVDTPRRARDAPRRGRAATREKEKNDARVRPRRRDARAMGERRVSEDDATRIDATRRVRGRASLVASPSPCTRSQRTHGCVVGILSRRCASARASRARRVDATGEISTIDRDETAQTRTETHTRHMRRTRLHLVSPSACSGSMQV